MSSRRHGPIFRKPRPTERLSAPDEAIPRSDRDEQEPDQRDAACQDHLLRRAVYGAAAAVPVEGFAPLDRLTDEEHPPAAERDKEASARSARISAQRHERDKRGEGNDCEGSGADEQRNGDDAEDQTRQRGCEWRCRAVLLTHLIPAWQAGYLSSSRDVGLLSPRPATHRTSRRVRGSGRVVGAWRPRDRSDRRRGAGTPDLHVAWRVVVGP